MEEAEARRKRLKALREEAQEPQEAYGGGMIRGVDTYAARPGVCCKNISSVAHAGLGKLANPLIDAFAAKDSPSGFSFYRYNLSLTC